MGDCNGKGAFTHTAYNDFEIVAANLLDNDPPFSLTNASNNAYTQMGFAELYTARGRYFYVTAKYAFR